MGRRQGKSLGNAGIERYSGDFGGFVTAAISAANR